MANDQKYITTGTCTGVNEFLALNGMAHSELAELAGVGRGMVSTAIRADHIIVINSLNKPCIVPARYQEAFK